jgi:hypothetical protein
VDIVVDAGEAVGGERSVSCMVQVWCHGLGCGSCAAAWWRARLGWLWRVGQVQMRFEGFG